MCTHREGDRVALALKTREVAARCMLLYAGPYRREPPFPRRAGVVMREDQQATAEEAVLRSPYRVISKGPRQRKIEGSGRAQRVPDAQRPPPPAGTTGANFY